VETKGFLKTKKKEREESDKTVPYDDQHLKTRHIEQGKFPHSFDQQDVLRLERDGGELDLF